MSATTTVTASGKEIRSCNPQAGQAPRGVATQVRGQVNALKEIFAELAVGLALAVVVILLLLTANFQSFRLAWSSSLPFRRYLSEPS